LLYLVKLAFLAIIGTQGFAPFWVRHQPEYALLAAILVEFVLFLALVWLASQRIEEA